MTKRYLFNWCVWIGLATGVYTALYIISPLAQYGVVYATFVALPIYFISGAKRSEYINFTSSNVMGVIWGWIYIFLIGWCINLGMNATLANALVCGVITVVCCSFHFIVTPNTPFNKLPAMFGGIAVCFSTGGEKILPLMITLVLGSTLALVCQEGTHLLTEDGHWKFLQKKTPETENIQEMAE